MKTAPRPEGAVETGLQVCRDCPIDALIGNVSRPFRAGRYVGVFPGLKPRADSFGPLGTNFP
jgi:hypothetical protein